MLERRLRKGVLVVAAGTALVGAALDGVELYRGQDNDANRTNLTGHTTNDLVPGANDYDREKVRKDAEGFQLAPEWEAVDKQVRLTDHVHDDFIAGANTYDHDRIRQIAGGFQLSPEMEKVPDPKTESEQAK